MHVTYTQDQSVPWYIYHGMKRLGFIRYSSPPLLPFTRDSLSLFSRTRRTDRLSHFSLPSHFVSLTSLDPSPCSPHQCHHHSPLLTVVATGHSGPLTNVILVSSFLSLNGRLSWHHVTVTVSSVWLSTVEPSLYLSRPHSLSLALSQFIYEWERRSTLTLTIYSDIYYFSLDLLWTLTLTLTIYSELSLSHSQILWPCGWLPDWVRV